MEIIIEETKKGEREKKNQDQEEEESMRFRTKGSHVETVGSIFQTEKKIEIKGWKKKILNYWKGIQKRFPILEGNEESGYGTTMPSILIPSWIWIQTYKNVLIRFFLFSLFLFVFWMWFSNMYFDNVNHFLIDNRDFAKDNDGNEILNFFDLNSNSLNIPTKNKHFDEWLLKNENITIKFSKKEFNSGIFESTIFLNKDIILHDNDKTIYNFTIHNLEETMKIKCQEISCKCLSLFQLGLFRNVIYLWDPIQKNYSFLYDPEIMEKSPLFFNIKYSFDSDLPDDQKNYIREQIPNSILIRYHSSSSSFEKFNTIEYSNVTSACVFNSLKIQFHYSTFLQKKI